MLQDLNDLKTRLIIYINDLFLAIEPCQTTNEGPQKFEECIFPFLHRSYIGGYYRRYEKCAIDKSDGKVKWWCSTKVDHFGIHIEGRGNWGYCADDCPIQNNTIMRKSENRKKSSEVLIKGLKLTININPKYHLLIPMKIIGLISCIPK